MRDRAFTHGDWSAFIAEDRHGKAGVMCKTANGQFVLLGDFFPDIRTVTERADSEAFANARLAAAGPRMYALLREGLTGIKADGQFTDDTWLARVRDLLEDEIDTDNEGEAE